MNASTLAVHFGGVAGRDLEAEIELPRTQEREAHEADEPRGTQRIHAGDQGHRTPVTTETATARSGARANDPAVELRRVSKRYGDRVVLDGFDLSIERGSFVAIVGRSGCGKSTLLRLVAGLEAPDAGELTRRDEHGAPLETRMMFQDARLLPWKTVLQNVMLGLGRGARDDARAVLDEVGLLARADEWPARLSGGQRQRVALARALVHRPSLLLLDEPLGALDALTRIEMHALIERLWREHRFTALLVTHDVHEAVALGDRILLVEQGCIALDQRVPLERPRARADARFAGIEERVLRRVLGSETPASAHAPRANEMPYGLRPAEVRWAV
ncbi:Vitamin B12 import ATP-binding protein BtuD [Paraburkholderia caffeinitolerans]|uniref:Vitamin B12 import ATP-binding protein BtuD n=1 Tax=Paraburkholderia caffeinitolerans TaxID=1723730 RepID=A0A6J5FFH9_9BURK|nr:MULTISPECIES: ATP-binding cassette domain-containing protein [Paraburkholderia]CAB3779210.1 Vitamin B12 import ATP-binding protein BtuD [Paraburkholderia caffeinitolerans]